MKPFPISINKRMLWRYVNGKLNHSINHAHVFSVICILFEELFEDFKNGKDVKIYNFGTFQIRQMKPRRYHHVKLLKMMESCGYKILRFSLSKKIRTKLCNSLDVDKTFEDNYNE